MGIFVADLSKYDNGQIHNSSETICARLDYFTKVRKYGCPFKRRDRINFIQRDVFKLRLASVYLCKLHWLLYKFAKVYIFDNL